MAAEPKIPQSHDFTKCCRAEGIFSRVVSQPCPGGEHIMDDILWVRAELEL